ncbi:MAG: helix-turn-helix transcriptional regulator [Holosporales bacterium]|jgi:transcriptional regulator with XRE-family HTH domain|nr:helix-turn-helix transcriptional regulator [Holosporales bacterium]
MKKKIVLHIPVKRALRKLSKDIKEARIRRNITIAMVAERAGVTAITVAKIEQGDPSVSFGTYATVIFILGMIDKLQNLLDLSGDIIGRQLAEEQLPKRVRLPKLLRPNSNTGGQ